MIIIDRVELFVNFCESTKKLTRQKIKDLLGLKRYKCNETKLILEEYLTLIILYRFSGYKSLNTFWYHEKNHSNNCWPNMPSYNTFVVWINRLSQILHFFLSQSLSSLNQGLGMIDSTKIETSTPYWWGKVHKDAKKGYSSTGEFRGFKLHALINVHDLTPIKNGFLQKQSGVILADSGYVSKDMYFKLMEKNTLLIAKPKKVMMENNQLGLGYINWEKYKKMYKKRTQIERFFSYLKSNLNMKVNQTHSEKAFYTHIYSSLLAKQWLTMNILKYKKF